jgi:hypothetical protein
LQIISDFKELPANVKPFQTSPRRDFGCQFKKRYVIKRAVSTCKKYSLFGIFDYQVQKEHKCLSRQLIGSRRDKREISNDQEIQ